MKKNKTKDFIKKTRERSIKLINRTNRRFISEKEKLKDWLQKTKMVLVEKKVFDLQLYLADAVSFLNLTSGLISIYFSLNREFTLAAIFILVAVIFDSLDGSIARFLKRESLLGLQLDSLADLVSFGVAITTLLMLKYSFYLPLTFAAFVLVGCGAYRLARYNVIKVTSPDNKTYLGTPITLNGILFPVLLFFEPSQYIITALLLLMSVLMISKIKIKKLF
ncbi:MAG: CDP-diacylglycerol--serine O-phosphatidyltransferase [Nanoarchaeota archaeon]